MTSMGNCVVNDPEEEEKLLEDYVKDQGMPGGDPGQNMIRKQLIMSVKWNKWFECFYHQDTHVMKCINAPVAAIKRVSGLGGDATI